MGINTTGNPGHSVFDLPPGEETERLRQGTEAALSAATAKGLPAVYRDGRCPTPGHFIHEYTDGRTYLVLVDAESQKETVVRELPHA